MILELSSESCSRRHSPHARVMRQLHVTNTESPDAVTNRQCFIVDFDPEKYDELVGKGKTVGKED